MTESSLFEDQKKKLEGICEENKLTFGFKRKKYPISLVIRPLADMDTQMTMLETAEDSGYTSPDAYIKFTFKEGGVTRNYGGQFTITDTLQNKLENIFKKMCSFYLQHFFRYTMENELLSVRQMPEVDDTPINLPDCEDPTESLPDEEGGE